MQLLPLLSTAMIVASAVCVAVGWNRIARRRTKEHERWMVAAAVLATLFFVLYAARTVFVGNTAFGGPEALVPYYRAFLLFHIVLAAAGGVLGLVTLRLAYAGAFARHRRFGPATAVVWFATAVTGVAVYVLLYVLYPGGETKPLWQAIFG
ncbi:MAG: hypothetical protein BLM47_07020 [Candidatus Reconcilbacillus cellulovorans]|uniref:DUF420 domain-containing protein n=1 Tax=Candidatus Reconcilbacillus cellulovorans TaxID=1906605 RepID=A0A2A6E0G9_9BACL|nr:MAG: hypothetical protein BLM47_07020 [Candidatus Reconcilbacillus cellulovorans]